MALLGFWTRFVQSIRLVQNWPNIMDLIQHQLIDTSNIFETFNNFEGRTYRTIINLIFKLVVDKST